MKGYILFSHHLHHTSHTIHIIVVKMWLVALVFTFMLAVVAFLDSRKPKNYPPGPNWLPVLGSSLAVHRGRTKTGYFRAVCHDMTKEYGDKGILGLKIGKDRIVIAGSLNVIREMMVNEDLDGKPIGLFFEIRTWGERLGLILTDEDLWRETRRFVVRHLKDFGFGRRGMAELIQVEVEQILIDMKKRVNDGNGSAVVEMHNHFAIHVLNTLWSMMAGIRYSKEDKEMNNLQKLFYDLFTNIDMIGCMFSHFPILRFIAPDLSGYNRYVSAHKKFWDFLGDEIKNHKKMFREENEDRDFIDVYIRLLKTEKREHFSEKQLMAVCLDMFLAGSETTNKSLGFAFLNLVKHKHVQNKAQEEIDAVIGRNRLPTLDDRIHMPYNEAIVMESIRHFMGRSFGVPHRALKDTKLAGFHIPKDTTVIANYYGLLMSGDNFPNVNDFTPERFLCDGKIKIPDPYMPFGIGKHRCIGENMAKSNIFLSVVTLLQNFTFTLPEGHPPIKSDGIDGATPSASPFFAVVTPRPMPE